MLQLIAFVMACAALVRFTRGWTRGILLTVLIVGAILVAL
jgi:hypothetical protein